MLMVQTMDRDPTGRGILQAADGQSGNAVFEPFRQREGAMRQHSVETEVDTQRSEDVELSFRTSWREFGWFF
jgi:hypothetical protein